MSTTKIRKKTPMKNKTALWRRMAKKENGIGNGRTIRSIMMQMEIGKKQAVTNIFSKMMAGIGLVPKPISSEAIDNASEIGHTENSLSVGDGTIVTSDPITLKDVNLHNRSIA